MRPNIVSRALSPILGQFSAAPDISAFAPTAPVASTSTPIVPSSSTAEGFDIHDFWNRWYLETQSTNDPFGTSSSQNSTPNQPSTSYPSPSPAPTSNANAALAAFTPAPAKFTYDGSDIDISQVYVPPQRPQYPNPQLATEGMRVHRPFNTLTSSPTSMAARRTPKARQPPPIATPQLRTPPLVNVAAPAPAPTRPLNAARQRQAQQTQRPSRTPRSSRGVQNAPMQANAYQQSFFEAGDAPLFGDQMGNNDFGFDPTAMNNDFGLGPAMNDFGLGPTISDFEFDPTFGEPVWDPAELAYDTLGAMGSSPSNFDYVPPTQDQSNVSVNYQATVSSSFASGAGPFPAPPAQQYSAGQYRAGPLPTPAQQYPVRQQREGSRPNLTQPYPARQQRAAPLPTPAQPYPTRQQRAAPLPTPAPQYPTHQHRAAPLPTPAQQYPIHQYRATPNPLPAPAPQYPVRQYRAPPLPTPAPQYPVRQYSASTPRPQTQSRVQPEPQQKQANMGRQGNPYAPLRSSPLTQSMVLPPRVNATSYQTDLPRTRGDAYASNIRVGVTAQRPQQLNNPGLAQTPQLHAGAAPLANMVGKSTHNDGTAQMAGGSGQGAGETLRTPSPQPIFLPESPRPDSQCGQKRGREDDGEGEEERPKKVAVREGEGSSIPRAEAVQDSNQLLPESHGGNGAGHMHRQHAEHGARVRTPEPFKTISGASQHASVPPKKIDLSTFKIRKPNFANPVFAPLFAKPMGLEDLKQTVSPITPCYWGYDGTGDPCGFIPDCKSKRNCHMWAQHKATLPPYEDQAYCLWPGCTKWKEGGSAGRLASGHIGSSAHTYVLTRYLYLKCAVCGEKPRETLEHWSNVAGKPDGYDKKPYEEHAESCVRRKDGLWKVCVVGDDLESGAPEGETRE